MFLGGLWLFQATNLVFWEHVNKRLYAWDEVAHFFDSVAVAKVLASPAAVLDLRAFLSTILPPGVDSWVWSNFSIFPPFVYSVTSSFYIFSKPSMALAASSNVVFLGILIVSVYGLTKIVIDQRAGLAAAVLVSFYPLLLGISRRYYLDFPLVAMVSLSLFMLVKTRMFQNRKMVLLLSFALVAGMLTKVTFPIYLAGPFLYTIAKIARNRPALKNLFLCVALASLSIAYYLIKPGGLRAYTDFYQTQQIQLRHVTPSPFLVAAVTYFQVMVRSGTGIAIFAVFLIGLGIVFIRRPEYRTLISSALVLPFVLLAVVFPVYYDARYIAPVLPLVAIVAASVFMNRFRRYHKSQLVVALVIGMLLSTQYVSMTYDVSSQIKFVPPAFSSSLARVFQVLSPVLPLSEGPPSNQDWRIHQILEDLHSDANRRNIRLPILVVSAIEPYFDSTLFSYYAYVDGVNVMIYDNGQFSAINGIRSVGAANYVVTRSNGTTVKGDFIFDNVAQVNAFVLSHLEGFTLLQRYLLPDGSVASLFLRIAALEPPTNAQMSTEVEFGVDTGRISKWVTD